MTVTTDPNQVYFFIHVMKVGGFSLVDMMSADIFPDAAQRYPNPTDGNPVLSGTRYNSLRSVRAERGQKIRVYCGHFPFAAARELGPVKTFALFRDPVDRVCSHIRHQLYNAQSYRNWTPEQVYADQGTRATFFDNLQLRMFAVQSIQESASVFEPTVLTESDIDVALENVRKVDVIGLTYEFENFVRLLGIEFGWQFRQLAHLNNTIPHEISSELRERIYYDTELDRKFYEGVCEIYESRKSAKMAEFGGELPRNIREAEVSRLFAHMRKEQGKIEEQA